MKKVSLFIWIGLLIQILSASALFSQMIIRHPVEILEGLSGGTIQATVNPSFTLNSINNVFDGNNYTMAGAQNTNDLSITLAFSDTVKFSRTKIFFWSGGDWSLEIANTESDLNSGTGSYQLLVNQRLHTAFVADSVDVGFQSALYVRFKAHNPQENYIYLGEWDLIGTLVLTKLYIYPRPIKVIPGTTLNLKVKALDASNKVYDYPGTEALLWFTGNSSIATVGEFGELTGVALGNTNVLVRSYSNSISGQAQVDVVTDFQSVNAPTKIVKVALVVQNPVIDSVNNRRIHQVWGWSNPYSLVNSIIEDLTWASEGVINFQIVETHDDANIFTEISSVPMTMQQVIYYFTPSNNRLYGRNTPGTLQYMAEIQNIVKFNYNAMVDFYDLDTKRNNGIIDEVWVYTFPFGGMYESQLMGPGAFWYNSPPLAHPGLNKLLSVMGWNYERGVAEALESFGHRSESALSYTFGRWQGYPPPENPNMWEIFTQIDLYNPGHAHCGNVHYPPNGLSDYDFANTRYVTSYCDNWKRYPFILDQTRLVNRNDWFFLGGDYHRGYMRWWYNHFPRFEGVYEGILNNWWHYIVDYEEAVALANSTPWVGIDEKSNPEVPGYYRLNQNYPNPFNPATVFSFYLPVSEKVTLKIYDLLGREVDTVINKKLTAGEHSIEYHASKLASGIYFYELKTEQFSQTKKMVLLK